MPEFNFVAEIGGVDTSDLTRPYSPVEQRAVIERIYGDSSQQGCLMLPNGKELYVGRRNSSEGYSIGRGSGIYHGLPALFVPSVGERALLILAADDETPCEDGNQISGFLTVAVGKLLSLGKHVYSEVIRGEESDFRRRASPGHIQARDCLMHIVLENVLDEAEDPEEGSLEELDMAIEDFLGPELAAKEKKETGDENEAPFEEFTIELMRRMSLHTQEVK
jgi:hypothetical protein